MTAGGQTAEMFQPPEDGGFHAFDPANVAPLVGYLASPEAGGISGEVYVVWGNQVQVAQRPTLMDAFVNPKGDAKWEVEDLHATMASRYEDNYMPVWSGFSMPPV